MRSDGRTPGLPGSPAICLSRWRNDVAATNTDKIGALLSGTVKVVNVGLESFADDLKQAGTPVIHVDWTPPAGGDPKLAALLARMGV